MITTKDLKDRELDSLTDFFNYICDNYSNGNNGDVKKFIKKMSREQKLEFHYFVQGIPNDEMKQALNNTLVEILLNPDF